MISPRTWRNVDPIGTEFAYFTSFLYKLLDCRGSSGVQRWTRDNRLDIFSKKLISLPVNLIGHWSLAVIVHPGKVDPLEAGEMRQHGPDDPCPCLLLLDSYNFHPETEIHQRILDWLNYEWNKLRKKSDDDGDGDDEGDDDEDAAYPFNEQTFPLHKVRGKCNCCGGYHIKNGIRTHVPVLR